MDDVQVARETTKTLKGNVVDSIHELMQYMNSVFGDKQTVELMTKAIVFGAIERFEFDE